MKAWGADPAPEGPRGPTEALEERGPVYFEMRAGLVLGHAAPRWLRVGPEEAFAKVWAGSFRHKGKFS